MNFMSLFCCVPKPNLYLEDLGDEAFSGNAKAVELFRQGKKYELKSKTYTEAIDCFRQAAELGLVAGQVEYGISLVYENQQEARVWFQKAADKNSELAGKYLYQLDNLQPGKSFPTSARSGNSVVFMNGFPEQ